MRLRFFLRNRFFALMDVVGWSLIPAAALALRLDGISKLPDYAVHLALFTAIAICCKFLVHYAFGLYNRYWLYASVDEVSSIAKATLMGSIATTLVYFLAIGAVPLGGLPLPRSLPLIDALLTVLYVGANRISLRVIARANQKRKGKAGRERVLIVGAGNAGTMIARELDANPQLNLEPIGFVDDDELKQGRTILGLPILGPCEDIPQIAQAYGIKTAIIAIPTAPGRVIRRLRECCDVAKLATKIIPGVFDIISGRVTVNHVRDIQIDDLLRREPVKIDQQAVRGLIGGSTILVTGAGGSIGSEVCRQVAELGVQKIIMVGHDENGIFEIDNELRARFPAVNVVPLIADVRHSRRLELIFDLHRPKVIFHAAAHKHVPLMELNPEEAVANNIGGTLSAIAAAEKAEVERFVFISTDKAVNPSSVMGFTKLIAENLVCEAALRTQRPYVSVRFGNVLGSNGSVVPLFRSQIAAGGPVTVTHPDVKRYFMTIPEAVQLVLQAAAMGEGGETFVLDMGEPVKIVQLARDLIELSGLEVGSDIEISFTGLRPGEKMFEELFMDSEEFEKTRHEKIFVARNGAMGRICEGQLAEVMGGADLGDAEVARRLIGEFHKWSLQSEGRTGRRRPRDRDGTPHLVNPSGAGSGI